MKEELLVLILNVRLVSKFILFLEFEVVKVEFEFEFELEVL